MKNLRLFALLLLLMSLSACADGSTGFADPPGPSPEMTWGDGNWDETNWPAEEPLTS